MILDRELKQKHEPRVQFEPFHILGCKHIHLDGCFLSVRALSRSISTPDDVSPVLQHAQGLLALRLHLIKDINAQRQSEWHLFVFRNTFRSNEVQNNLDQSDRVSWLIHILTRKAFSLRIRKISVVLDCGRFRLSIGSGQQFRPKPPRLDQKRANTKRRSLAPQRLDQTCSNSVRNSNTQFRDARLTF